MINSLKNLRLWAGFVIWIITFPFMCTAQSNAPPQSNSTVSINSSRQSYPSINPVHQESEKSNRRFLLTILYIYGSILLLIVLMVLLAAFASAEVEEIGLRQPRLVSGITINRPIELKPERRSYMLRNGLIPFVLFLFMLWYSYPYDSATVLKNAPTPLALAFLWLIVEARLYNTTIYELDETEIRIKSKLIRGSVDITKYHAITKVQYDQAFFEKKRNVGTVELTTGFDDEGNPVTTRLISIYNHKEIAFLIAEKAGIKICPD